MRKGLNCYIRAERETLGYERQCRTRRIDFVRLVGRRGFSLAIAGLGAGTVLAAVALRAVASVLEQPLPATLPVAALTAAVLALIVLGACIGPAVRSVRTDPSAALR